VPHAENLIPTEVVLDINRQNLQNNQSRVRKNLDHHGKDGSGMFAITGLPANELYDPTFSLPNGENLKAGEGYSAETNETYILTWNENMQHALYRIKNGACQMVFVGPELNASKNPEKFAGETRFHVERLCLGDRTKTFVLYLDADDKQRFLCVEDSIATHYFDAVLFPYFAGTHYRRTELINLGVPTPVDCIGITPVSTTDTGMSRLKKHFWRFRIKTIDVYGRPSEHGIISDGYYQGDCHTGNINCLDLSFDAGGPLVDKIQIEYNNDGTTEWHIHQTINKYKKCSTDWWTRQINDADFTFDKEKNRIIYRFCAGGECIPVPDKETERNENPLPIKSQSLFALAGGIGLANNQYNPFGPFACDIMDKIHFEVERPAPGDNANFITRNIIIDVVIVNAFEKRNQAIWKQGDNIVFGGIGDFAPTGLGTPTLQIEEGVGGKFGQVFPDQQEGFNGYLAGTRYAATSRQFRAVVSNGVITGYKEWGAAQSSLEAHNGIWIQRFEFKNVPPGKYIFRIAGHGSSLNDSNYQRTSTYVAGTAGLDNGGNPVWSELNNTTEILIDVCNEDYDSKKKKQFLQIYDLTHAENDGQLQRNSRAVSGYVYEDRDNQGVGVLPIETATIVVKDASIVRKSIWTDHNGFYFVAARDGNYKVSIRTSRKCGWEQFPDFSVNISSGLITHDFVAYDNWNTYLDEKCNRVLMRGRIVDCVTGANVPNIVIGITRGSFTSSNEKGEFELVVHDKEGGRQEKVLFMSAGACRILTCAGEPCLPLLNYVQPNCSIVQCAERPFVLPDYQVKVDGVLLRGLQQGGRYATAVSGGDWMDRGNFAQTKPVWHLDIPTVNETQSWKYSRIKWTIDPSARFPLDMDRLHLRISKNLAYNDFISWVVDRVEFMDNSGFENKISPTKIRIHYSSLNEYNKQNNFSSNTTWQIIDEKDSIETKDIVHFVANGNGKLFPKVITEQVRFDKDGRYFDVDFNADIKELSEGALIKIMRPGTCKNAEIFYELCKTVIIKNGIPTETSGYLNAFDSYYVSRQIPTPVVTVKKVKKVEPSSTNNTIIFTEVEESETTNVIKPYSWLFEHHSPSDLWGDHCANLGRPLISDPLESVICRETEIALSGALGVNGLTNYLHYFDDARKKQFEDQGWAGITGVIVQSNSLLVICGTDWFTVEYDDNSVVFSAAGRAIVKTAEKQFGIPTNKEGKNFGCLPADRNTISYCNGKVLWYSRHNLGIAACNFHTAEIISDNRYSTYFRNKSKGLRAGNRYFHAKYNPKENQYYITDFNLSDLQYINAFPGFQYDLNDTLAIDVDSGELRKSCSFTPEGFAHLRGDVGDQQFFSFKKGIPYAHHRLNPTKFNEFFGVPVPWAIQPSVGIDIMKVKQFLSLEFYSKDTKCYVPKVFTESGQVSKIPRNFFQRGDRYSVGPFLCDINMLPDPNRLKETGVNALTDGDNLRGRWVEFLVMADPDNMTSYFEITGLVVNMNGVQTKQNEGGKP
jgi:hypothetical protein